MWSLSDGVYSPLDLLAKSLTIDEDDVSALLVTEEASESANDSEILPGDQLILRVLRFS